MKTSDQLSERRAAREYWITERVEKGQLSEAVGDMMREMGMIDPDEFYDIKKKLKEAREERANKPYNTTKGENTDGNREICRRNRLY